MMKGMMMDDMPMQGMMRRRQAFLSLIDRLLWQLASGSASSAAHLEMPLTWSR